MTMFEDEFQNTLPENVWIAGNCSPYSGVGIYGIFAKEEQAEKYLSYYISIHGEDEFDHVWPVTTGFVNANVF